MPRMIGTGEIHQSMTGRDLTPVPKVDCTTNKKSINTIKRIDAWLIENSIDEAKAKNDDFNLLYFEHVDINNISPADRDSMNLYLFGDV